MKLVEVNKKAFIIRNDFEKNKINYTLLKKEYMKYNKIKGIHRFIKKSKILFPKLNCGLASVYLKHFLGGEVIKGKYKKQDHTFLFLGNKIVVDITADQYGGPKIYIGPIKEPWSV